MVGHRQAAAQLERRSTRLQCGRHVGPVSDRQRRARTEGRSKLVGVKTSALTRLNAYLGGMGGIGGMGGMRDMLAHTRDEGRWPAETRLPCGGVN